MSELGISGYRCAYCGKIGKVFTIKTKGLWCRKCPLPKPAPKAVPCSDYLVSTDEGEE